MPTMLEKHRLTYLENLGIESYMPTKVLSYAAPSVLLSDEALQEPTAFSTADMPASPVTTSDQISTETLIEASVSSNTMAAAPSPVDDVMANLLGNSVGAVKADSPTAAALSTTPSTTPSIDSAITPNVSSEANAPQTSPAIDSTPSVASASVVGDGANNSTDNSANKSTKTNASNSNEPIRFSLNVWRIGSDMMVIDSRQPGAALPTDRLLQNILRSVGLPLAQLPPSELLRWPLYKSDSLENEEAEARAMVQAYISAQCTKTPTKTLMLLGENAVRFALSIDSADDHSTFYEQYKGTAIAQPQWNNTAIIAPSLIDMLQEPLQKRITWAALQTLFI